ncbi:hypothetical protein BKA62DRAFT_356399 [Auriculariales sp. MPI-PUGE-AT-0066]|nr:hypothetical protein BKA62DRAFT_356399 [Auriculariales sp. MPI-PUGE-AT-0066]
MMLFSYIFTKALEHRLRSTQGPCSHQPVWARDFGLESIPMLSIPSCYFLMCHRFAAQPGSRHPSRACARHVPLTARIALVRKLHLFLTTRGYSTKLQCWRKHVEIPQLSGSRLIVRAFYPVHVFGGSGFNQACCLARQWSLVVLPSRLYSTGSWRTARAASAMDMESTSPRSSRPASSTSSGSCRATRRFDFSTSHTAFSFFMSPQQRSAGVRTMGHRWTSVAPVST